MSTRQSLIAWLMLLPALAAVELVAARVGTDELVGPGNRVLLDAHNCYPYEGRWTDRLDRALATSTPLAIEQDLIWYATEGAPRSIVAHGLDEASSAPGLREHFFERIRPLVERALVENRRGTWPIITLNLDLKSDEPEHHAAIWALLGEYETWLTTAERRADPSLVTPFEVRPILVLTGSQDAQQASFHDRVPVGERLRLFGAIHVPEPTGETDDARLISAATITAEDAIPERVTNYRRWVNFPWAVVEQGGQTQAADWTSDERTRLEALVDRAHAQGLWIRFYTLNGTQAATSKARGWTPSYNFGSLEAVELRWRAAMEAGVDFVATDQYEELGQMLRAQEPTSLVSMLLNGYR